MADVLWRHKSYSVYVADSSHEDGWRVVLTGATESEAKDAAKKQSRFNPYIAVRVVSEERIHTVESVIINSGADGAEMAKPEKKKSVLDGILGWL